MTNQSDITFEIKLIDILYGTEENHFSPKDNLPTFFSHFWKAPKDFDSLSYRQRGELIDAAYYEAMKALSEHINHEVFDCESIVTRM